MKQLLEKNLISTKEASELSGYNSDYLSRLCRENKIEGTQVGRTWLVSRSSLQSFIRSQEERKRGLAESLSKEREREYRKVTSPVAKATRAAGKVHGEVDQAIKSTLLSASLYSRGLKLMARSSSLVATGLILALSAYAAGTGALENFADRAVVSALSARESFIDSVNALE
ncbi:helix-turn-helix domain-containing protein, partial [Patescibacteria group bacterium]|nr:helix-turn-helix domain-containing protein [Patescibacteria group bacterium]